MIYIYDRIHVGISNCVLRSVKWGVMRGTHGRVRVVQEIFHGVVGLRERLLEDTRHRRDGAVVVPAVGVDLPQRRRDGVRQSWVGLGRVERV